MVRFGQDNPAMLNAAKTIDLGDENVDMENQIETDPTTFGRAPSTYDVEKSSNLSYHQTTVNDQRVPEPCITQSPTVSRWNTWLSRAECHGLSRFQSGTTRHKPTRIFWAVVLSVCGVMMIVQTFQAINHYYGQQYDHVEPLESKLILDLIPQFQYRRRLNRRKTDALNITNTEMSSLLYTLLSPTPFAKIPDLVDLENLIRWQEQHRLPYSDMWSVLGFECSDLIQSVAHREYTFRPCLPTVDAYPVMSRNVFTQEFGQCTQLVFSPELTSRHHGLSHTVRIALKYDEEERPRLLENMYLDEGFAVQVGYNLEPGSWTSVSRGFRTQLGVQKVMTKAGQPCSRDDHKIFTKFVANCSSNGDQDFKLHQRQSLPLNCESHCLLRFATDRCKCMPWYTVDEVHTCEIEDFVQCVYPFHPDQAGTPQEIIDGCMSKCQQPCNEESYDIRMSQAVLTQFLTSSVENATLYDDDETPTHNLGAILDLYYYDLDTKVVERQTSTPFWQFMAHLGGLWSVWFGASIITMIQAFTYCVCPVVTDTVEKRPLIGGYLVH